MVEDSLGNLWNRLARGFSFSFLGQLANYAIAFLLAPIYARALTPIEYGVISQANSIRSILMLLMPMGTAGAVTYWYNLHRERLDSQKRALGAIAGLGLITSLVWLFLSLIVGGGLQRWLLPDFPLAFWPYGALVIVSAWMLTLQTAPLSFLGAEERQGAVAALNVGLGLLQAGWIILMVVGLRRGPAGQVEAMALYGACSAPVFLWLLLRFTRPNVTVSLWPEVAAYSLPLLPHQMSVWALNLSDRLIIGHYGKRFASDLGLYSFGYSLAMVMLAVGAALSVIWSPVYMEQARRNPNAKGDLGLVASWCILALALTATGLILFAPEVAAFIGGARYIGSSRYVAPVVLGYFMQAVYLFPAMALFHLRKTSHLPVITVLSGALNVGINLVLIPHYGVIVAAWSTAIGFTCMAIMAFFLGHPPFPLRYRAMPIILSGVSLAVAFSFLHAPMSTGWLSTKALVWVGLALSGLLGWRWFPSTANRT